MKAELDTEGLPVEVAILGINAIGLEAGNPSITSGRTIPWLQDTLAENVWSTWAPTYRDVVILDTQNQKIDVYNVTVYNLADPANYATLKDKLRAASLAAP
jgi:hypothetical protein